MSGSTRGDQDNDQPSVAVIVAVRNGASTIARCIESVAAQRGCRAELIIVDALSDDLTPEIVRSFGSSVSTYIREADTGISHAWNKALAVTSSDWCLFLGADDFLLNSDALSQLLRCADDALPPPDLIYGGVVRQGGAAEYTLHPAPEDPVGYLRGGRMLPHQALLHRVSRLRLVGGFDETFRLAGDRDAAVRVAREGRVVRCNATISAMHVGGITSQWEHQRQLQHEVARIVRRERGPLFAALQLAMRRIHQITGFAVEHFLLAVFGRRRGTAIALSLRKALGYPPKLMA